MHGSFKQNAQKELNIIPKKTGFKIISTIELLANNPRPVGSKKLSDSVNAYRIRIGDYRVIDSVFDEQLIVDVIKINHRKQIYKKR